MNTFKTLRYFLFPVIFMFLSVPDLNAGEYPKTLTAYRGTTPVLDGYISEGEYSDAESVTGVSGWHSDTGVPCDDSLDLSVKVYYKHDGEYLYFAFDVVDNIVYGYDTELWTPDRNPDANSLIRGEGWPWFGDGLEIMMNSTYTWNETKKSVGDGTIWQAICSMHKSTLGGLGVGGLIEGVPLNEYAWTNYKDWYTNEYMKASVRVKSEEEGSGFVIEWRISPDPCMQVSENTFVDLSKENKVGINLEFEDIDNPDDGNGSGNLTQFAHVDYMTKLDSYRKNIAKGFATLILTPEKMNPENSLSSISEDYESSQDLPASHNIVSGNMIKVMQGVCDNSNLMISKLAEDSASVIVPFLWMDEFVYSSFDVTPEDGNMHFKLMSENGPAVEVSFADDSIRYFQNGNSSAWMAFKEDSRYRIKIIADNKSKKYSLNVNGDLLQDLDFNDTSGMILNSFVIYAMKGSESLYALDNLIIQDSPIEESDLYSFENCWELTYDYENSLELPSDHAITAVAPSEVSVKLHSECSNNSLVITDSLSTASTLVEVPFEAASGIVQVQFTVDARQDTGLVSFELREEENSIVKVGLNNNKKFFYYNGNSMIDWMDYDANTKYSFQIVADNKNNMYDFIVNEDTISDLSFYNNSVSAIDNLIISTEESAVGDYLIDNLVISNKALDNLVHEFDECAEQNTPALHTASIDEQFRIYPNPTNGILTIELAGSVAKSIHVLDIHGREICSIIPGTKKTVELDLSLYESGMYLVNINSNQGRSFRLIQLIK